MDKIKVNTVSLDRTNQDISTKLKDIERRMQSLEGHVSEMNSMWKGTANASFNRAFLDDINRLAEIAMDIGKVCTFEAQASKEYASCEQKVSQLVAGIRV